MYSVYLIIYKLCPDLVGVSTQNVPVWREDLGDMSVLMAEHGFSREYWRQNPLETDPNGLISGGDEGRQVVIPDWPPPPRRSLVAKAPESRCFCWTLLAQIDLQDLLCCVHMGKKDHQSDKGLRFLTFCPVWIWGGYSIFISHMRETRSEDTTYPGYAIPTSKMSFSCHLNYLVFGNYLSL